MHPFTLVFFSCFSLLLLFFHRLLHHGLAKTQFVFLDPFPEVFDGVAVKQAKVLLGNIACPAASAISQRTMERDGSHGT
jgi:hypothetical protein